MSDSGRLWLGTGCLSRSLNVFNGGSRRGVEMFVGKRSPQYGGLPGGEHQCQFVDESLTLAHNRPTVVFDLLRAIRNLHGLPTRHMQAFTGAKDPIQHTTDGA